jgi:hypothetical protein
LHGISSLLSNATAQVLSDQDIPSKSQPDVPSASAAERKDPAECVGCEPQEHAPPTASKVVHVVQRPPWQQNAHHERSAQLTHARAVAPSTSPIIEVIKKVRMLQRLRRGSRITQKRLALSVPNNDMPPGIRATTEPVFDAARAPAEFDSYLSRAIPGLARLNTAAGQDRPSSDARPVWAKLGLLPEDALPPSDRTRRLLEGTGQRRLLSGALDLTGATRPPSGGTGEAPPAGATGTGDACGPGDSGTGFGPRARPHRPSFLREIGLLGAAHAAPPPASPEKRREEAEALNDLLRRCRRRMGGDVSMD